MAILRALGGVILGVAVAVVAGAIVDYLRLYPAEEAARIPFLYPWLTGLGGLLGAVLTALLLLPPALRAGQARGAAVGGKAGAKGAGGMASATGGVAQAGDISAMPSFDFDGARKQSAAERKAIEGMHDPPAS